MIRFSKALTLCLAMILSGIVASAQSRQLSGKVVDSKGGPVPGAVVMVKDANNGVITGDDGSYNIKIDSGDVTLVISALSYATQEVRITAKSKNVLNIVLEEDALVMDEVVVVGYGEQTRRSITSAVSKLGGEAIQDIPISTVAEGLKGKIAGLRVTQTDNAPGGEFTMRIRGGSSVNGDNAPLVLVDGVERDFSTINPNDIASIEVLKDAASSAIYGARASNGIILVSTKRGGYNKAPRITFEANLAYQEPETKIDFLGAEDYIRVTREAVAEYLDVPARAKAAQDYLDGATSAGIGNKPNGMYSTRYLADGETIPDGYKSMSDPLDPSKTIIFKETDWQSIMYRPALWQNYYVGVDGGSEVVRYKASLNYLKDNGVAISTGYDRINFKANLDARITKTLTAMVGFDYARTHSQEYENQRNIIARGLANPPTMNAYYDDGTPVEGYNATSQTPLFYQEYYDNNKQKNYLSLIGGLKWDIIEGLTANVQGSFFHQDTKTSSFVRENVFDATRKSSWAQNLTERIKADAYIQYKKTWVDAHNFSAMVGYSYQNRYYEVAKMAGTGSTSDKITTINGSSNVDISDVTSSTEKETQMGFFGRINYDYKGKYMISATFREDGSSKFVGDNRWGFFPGVSAGWVLTEEPWLKNVKNFDFFKLRASYGSTGNSGGVGVYDAYGAYGANYVYNGVAGIKPTEMPNEGLKWETTTQLDLGFEMGLVNNRIYLSFDYYDKYTHNLLYEQTLPNTTGFSSIWTNLGKVRFWGLELELTTHNIQKKNFNWDSKLVLSYNRNEVVSLPDNGIAQGRTGGIALGDGTFFGGIAEGEPLYRLYGYKALGIFQNEEDLSQAYYDNLSRVPSKGQKRIGDYEWTDRNGDGQITTADQFCLGVTVPTFTGGLNNDFRYKNWTLSIYLDWAMGHVIFDEAYNRYFYSTYTCNYALAAEVLKCWKQEGDQTRFAKFTANDSAWGNDNYNRSVNDIFTYKGDYLCIREISLQYSMPEKLFKKNVLKGVIFTLAGNNLYYFTQVKGISPEVGTASTYSNGYNNYPPVRRFSFGAKLIF